MLLHVSTTSMERETAATARGRKNQKQGSSSESNFSTTNRPPFQPLIIQEMTAEEEQEGDEEEQNTTTSSDSARGTIQELRDIDDEQHAGNGQKPHQRRCPHGSAGERTTMNDPLVSGGWHQTHTREPPPPWRPGREGTKLRIHFRPRVEQGRRHHG